MATSGLATYLQNELMTLSSEARRKNPEIKEAAERLSYILRALKERSTPTGANGVVDVVALELSKTDDVLKPFVLSCETKNPKLTQIAVGCLQRLISHHAVPESSIPLVLRTLETINNSMDLQLKILQTVLPLLTNYEIIHNDLLADALYLCFRLQDSKTAVVNNTAAATLRQLVVHVFEKVVLEDALLAGTDSSNDPLGPCAKDAFMLFQDLCVLSNNEEPSFLRKVGSLTKSSGLELIESILTNHHKLFKSHPELLKLLKDKFCPLVIRSFSDKNDFPLTIRLMRVLQIIVKHFHDVLNMEGEIFLSLLGKLVEPDHAPYWQRVTVLEIYRDICNDISLLRSIHLLYDSKDHGTKILQDMISSISRIIISERAHLLLVPFMPANYDAQGMNGTIPSDAYALSASTACVKMQCIDQLDKNEPPLMPDTYIIYLAMLAVINLVETTSSYFSPLLQKDDTQKTNDSSNELVQAIEIPKSCWSPVLATLSFLVNSSIDDDLFTLVIKTLQTFANTLGTLGLTAQRDAFIGTLCKACIPNPTNNTDSAAPSNMNFKTSTLLLHERNVVSLRALLVVAQSLTPVLEDRAWYVILDTLQTADGLVSMGKMGKRDNSSTQLLRDETLKEGRPRNTSYVPSSSNNSGAAPLDNLFVSIQSSIKKFFETSKTMEDGNFYEFVKALTKLAKDFCSTPVVAASASKDQMKIADEKSFAVSRIHELSVLNISRLTLAKPAWATNGAAPVPFQAWDTIVSTLVEISHHPHCPLSIRAQICSTLSEILTAAIQSGDLTDAVVEMKILSPLKSLLVVDQENNVDTAEEKDRISKSPWFMDIQKSGLEILYRLLQAAGQNIKAGWGLIFAVVRAVVGGNARARRQAALEKMVTEVQLSTTDGVEAAVSSGAKFASLVRVAFPCLQLICTDFLTLLSPAMLYECIETLSCFGFQMDDLNISLTSIGLLWSVSDFVLTSRQQLEKNDSEHPPEMTKVAKSETEVNETASNKSVSASKTFIKSPSVDRLLEEGLSKKSLDTLWMFLLSTFSQLCSDTRPEVRNSANQTLFRTIGMNGQRLTMDAWDECLWNVLFPLLDRVKSSSEMAEDREKLLESSSPGKDKPGTPSAKAASVMVHHSRNTAAKQWDETKVLTLNGITRSLLDFLPVLVDLVEFQKAWRLYLDFIQDWCLDGSPEVSMAAIKSLRCIVRYPKDMPDNNLPEKIQGKRIELWRDVWETWANIGLGVIYRADENKDTEIASELSSKWKTMGILHGNITQETLTLYVNILPDLFEIIQPTFGLNELTKLFMIFSLLPLYHTNSQPSLGGRRMDVIHDTENMTPLQAAILDHVAGVWVPAKVVDEHAKNLDFSYIDHSPEVVLTTVAWFTKIPFAARTSTEKGFTYIALSKKAMQTLATIFNQYKGLKSVYTSGVYAETLYLLGTALVEKYDCPAVGQKDSTPLWKAAATAFMSLVRGGLQALDDFSTDVTRDILDPIYKHMLDVFQAFLLPKSRPPTSVTPEEQAVDESFDISVLTEIQTEIILFLGKPYVPEETLSRLVSIILAGSKSYALRLDDSDSSDSSQKSTSLENLKIRGGVGLDVKVEVPPGYSLGSDIILLGREDFARSCFAFLFDLCSDQDKGKWIERYFILDNEPIRQRIARVISPVLLQKCKKVLQTFTADRALFGKCPLARIRNEELLFILGRLEQFSMREGVLVNEKDDTRKFLYMLYLLLDKIRAIMMSGSCALLYCLYPNLCDLLCVVSKTGVGSVGGEADEEKIVKSVRVCLDRLGGFFGCCGT